MKKWKYKGRYLCGMIDKQNYKNNDKTDWYIKEVMDK